MVDMNSKRILCRGLAVALTLSFVICNHTPSAFSKSRLNAHISTSTINARSTRSNGNAPRRRARTYDVVHYIIRTRFDVPNKTVIGEVDVTLKPLSTGFHSFDLDAANMKIERVALSSGAILRSVMRPDRLHITLDHVYQPSDNITVKIKYRAQPVRGLYFISTSHDDGFERPAQIWSQGEPEDNHYWFPCYDFPDDKATSEQYITTGGNEIAISNGTLLETANNANGSRTFHWQMDQPHSSYLISLIVGDYAKLTDSYKNIPLEYFTYHGTENQARRAFEKTPVIMNWFAGVLGYDFPYNRYAQTIVGNFIFGGMENITATTFADTEILHVEDGTPDSSAVNLVSHELSHSWFGDLVTCKDWANLWLNEGFATFMEAGFREHQEGREAYLAELQEDAETYFQEDPSREHHPLVNPKYPLSMELFDSTTYKKGAYVVHMLRETVGDETFWKALNVYLNEYKYRTVDSRDLQRVFERVSGQSLEWFFDQWVYKGGYPELTVRSSYDPATRRLTLGVTQTQRAGYITPAVFRLPVDLEIVTDTDTRTERIDINRRTQDFSFQLDSRPRSITFDKGARVLKKLRIVRSQVMTALLIIDGADAIALRKAAGMFGQSNFNLSFATYPGGGAISQNMLLASPFTTQLFARFRTV